MPNTMSNLRAISASDMTSDSYATTRAADPDIELLRAELSQGLAEGVIVETDLTLPTDGGGVQIDLFLMGIGGGVAISTRKGAFASLDERDFDSHPARLVQSFYEIGRLDVAYNLDAIVEVIQIRHPELFAQHRNSNAAVRLRRSGDMLHRYELVATTDEAVPLLLGLTESGLSSLASAA